MGDKNPTPPAGDAAGNGGETEAGSAGLPRLGISTLSLIRVLGHRGFGVVMVVGTAEGAVTHRHLLLVAICRTGPAILPVDTSLILPN